MSSCALHVRALKNAKMSDRQKRVGGMARGEKGGREDQNLT